MLAMAPHTIFDLLPGALSDLGAARALIAGNLQADLAIGPRAMLAARLVNVRTGQDPQRSWKWDGVSIAKFPITSSTAAELLGVNRSSVSKTIIIRRKATAETMAAVEQGKLSIQKAYLLTQPTKIGLARPHTEFTGGAADRARNRSAIYAHLKTALEELTSLPLPSDVVSIAVKFDRSDLIAKKLPQALKWLQEFNACLSSKN